MRFKHNNKGFSLVEVLIGVTILAIIATPLARAFITSAKTSVKAENIRRETVAAQNILEVYEATDIGVVLAQMQAGVEPFDGLAKTTGIEIYNDETHQYDLISDYGEADADGPGYRITLADIDGGEYDAILHIQANDKYFELNEKEIVHAKPMSAVYNQPSPSDPEPGLGQNYSPDIMAAQDIALQAQIDLLAEMQDEGGALPEIELTYNDFIDIMNRTVTIDIKEINRDAGVISCSALFQYEASYNGRDYSYEVVNEVYCEEYNYSGDGDYGLYFFYYPNLNSVTGSDIINIQNYDNLEMNIYLIRQNYGDFEQNKPLIYLREAHDQTGGEPIASVYPNYIIRETDKRFVYYWMQNEWQYIRLESDGTLGGLASQNRIYEVTLVLFEGGGGYKEPILTIDASSVE